MRFGRDKALEIIDGYSLLDKVISSVSRVSEKIIVVTSQEKIPLFGSVNCIQKVVVDAYPNKGVLGAIYTGLLHSYTPYVLVVGCDMPFLKLPLLQYMADITRKNNFDAIVPKLSGMIEPLHAIYSRNCLSTILILLQRGKFRVSDLINLVNTRYVCEDEIDKFDKDHLSFFNINNMDDLRRAHLLIKQMADF